MISFIRKMFGCLAVVGLVLVVGMPLMVYVPPPPANPDTFFGLLLIVWVISSLAHAISSLCGSPLRLVAFCAIGLFGWSVYQEWTHVTDPAYESHTPFLPEWAMWTYTAALLAPAVDQLLDIILPPWPWSRD